MRAHFIYFRMRTLITTMLFSIFSFSSNHLLSQVFQGDWEEIGPVDIPQVFAQDEAAVGIGRINDIELHPNWNGTSNRKILAGSFNGGMWFSENNGGTWENKNSDDWEVLGVSDIEYDPDDTNTIFVATGDPKRDDILLNFHSYNSEIR